MLWTQANIYVTFLTILVESTHHLFTAPVPEDEQLLFSGDERLLEQVRMKATYIIGHGNRLPPPLPSMNPMLACNPYMLVMQSVHN